MTQSQKEKIIEVLTDGFSVKAIMEADIVDEEEWDSVEEFLEKCKEALRRSKDAL